MKDKKLFPAMEGSIQEIIERDRKTRGVEIVEKLKLSGIEVLNHPESKILEIEEEKFSYSCFKDHFSKGL